MPDPVHAFRWRIAPLFTRASPWKKFAGAAAIGWTALIFYACFVPSGDVPHLRFPYADKWVHTALYLGFTILWAFTFPGGWRRLLTIAAVSILIGWLIEVGQGALPQLGRSYDWYDLLADAGGTILGVALWRWAARSMTRTAGVMN